MYMAFVLVNAGKRRAKGSNRRDFKWRAHAIPVFGCSLFYQPRRAQLVIDRLGDLIGETAKLRDVP
jgi:hypothetical protein